MQYKGSSSKRKRKTGQHTLLKGLKYKLFYVTITCIPKCINALATKHNAMKGYIYSNG